MVQTKQLGMALLALLLALPLVSAGFTADTPLIWGMGLGLLLLGAAVPIYAKLHRGDSCHEKSKRPLWKRHPFDA